MELNDKELIKRLVKSSELKCSQCLQFYECNSDDCEKVIAEKALALINRQQAEIERLKRNLSQCVDCDECPHRSEDCLCDISNNDDDCPLLNLKGGE